jgi:tripartite ATP-independent transporter DctM subunit
MLAVLYIIYVLIKCQINPEMGPPVAAELRNISLVLKFAALKKVILPLLIIFSVLGSIYSGVTSVSEAAAMGVVGVVLAAAIRRTLNYSMVRDSLFSTMSTCGLLIWLSIGANAMVGVYNLLGGITFLKSVMAGLPFAPIGIVIFMLFILIILGLFMDWFSIMLLTMPVFAPVVIGLGYDLIWFGILFNITMQIGYLSPPFGQAAFYLKSVTPPDISLNEIFNSMWPFMGLQLIGLILVLLIPDISLGLGRYLR